MGRLRHLLGRGVSSTVSSETCLLPLTLLRAEGAIDFWIRSDDVSLTIELRHSLIPDRLASAVIEAEIRLAHSHLVR